MKRETMFDSILTAPEFEDRCNLFVNQVLKIIPIKYPDLHVEARNQTTTVINPNDSAHKMVRGIINQRKGPDGEKVFLNHLTKDAQIQDLLSLIENTAVVEIKGNNRVTAAQVEKAVKKVIKLAKKYRGKYNPEPDDNTLREILLQEGVPLECIENNPERYLVFTFSDDPEGKKHPKGK